MLKGQADLLKQARHESLEYMKQVNYLIIYSYNLSIDIENGLLEHLVINLIAHLLLKIEFLWGFFFCFFYLTFF